MKIILSIIVVLCSFLPMDCQIQIGPTLSGVESMDLFGSAVAISDDGNTFVVGGPLFNSELDNVGMLQVYKYQNGEIIEFGSPLVGVEAESTFGNGVSISGDGNTIAAGITGSNPESVKVFRNNGTTWNQIGETIFGNPGTGSFGFSHFLSKDGNTIIIAGRFDGTVLSQSGRTSIYTYINGEWILKGQEFFGERQGDQLGRAVSISSSGDTIAFSIERYDGEQNDLGFNKGQVKVYHFDSFTSRWLQIGNSIEGVLMDEEIGSSLSMSGDGNTIAIGSRTNSEILKGGGKFFVYQLNHNSNNWDQMGQTIYGEFEESYFSWYLSLSLDGNWLCVSAPFYGDSEGEKKGLARVYKYTNGVWNIFGSDIVGESSGDLTGPVAISENGERLIVGSPRSDINGEDSGSASLYSLNNLSTNQNIENHDVVVFPNPINRDLFVKSLFKGEIYYRVISIEGEMLLKGKVENGLINLEYLEHGIYILHLLVNQNNVFKRIVKL